MSSTPTTAGPRVIRAAESDPTAPAGGLQRRLAISTSATGAEQLCMAYVVSPPRTDSGPHHHAHTETAAYCLSGRARVYYGDGLREFVEVGPGDFVFVPAHLPHIEVNHTAEPATFILARSSGEPIVVPIELAESDLAHIRTAYQEPAPA